MFFRVERVWKSLFPNSVPVISAPSGGKLPDREIFHKGFFAAKEARRGVISGAVSAKRFAGSGLILFSFALAYLLFSAARFLSNEFEIYLYATDTH
jgi:hypothetical protein